MRLSHITIRTRHLPQTRAFFIDVFGLKDGKRPDDLRHIPGYWLYWRDEPLVHLIMGHGSGSIQIAEAIDHVCFRLEGYTHFRSRLERLGVPYTSKDIPDIGERHITLTAPGGAVIDTVFAEPPPMQLDVNNVPKPSNREA